MRLGLPLAAACASLALLGPHGALDATALQDPPPADAAQIAAIDEAGLQMLLERVREAIASGTPATYFALLDETADRVSAQEFSAVEFYPGATGVTVKERDRQALPDGPPGTAFRMMIDTFAEHGDRARVATWLIDVRRAGDGAWRIAGQAQLSSVENLYRLSVQRTQQYAARNFFVRAEDLEVELVEGTVFLVNADDQVTGLVMIGRGVMRFRPTPPVEKAQVRIFAGSETLEAPFDTAYIRTGTLEAHASRAALRQVPVDARELRRAESVFREESVKTYVLDLGDLSTETWSLLPGTGDFLSEIRTRRYGTLTYVRSSAEPEDIFVIDRASETNISVYASQGRLEERGPFYHENDRDAYSVSDYDVDVAYFPDRQWIDGRARMRLTARERIAGQVNVKLADEFAVTSVHSDRFGRVFSLRARGMNTIVVHVPETLEVGDELTLTIAYRGRLEPQVPEREGLQFIPPAPILIDAEPSYLYSSRSLWYPQSPVANYATATIRVSVPEHMTSVATGEGAPGFPRMIGGQDGVPRRRLFAFRATRPVRYLSFLVSRLSPVETSTAVFDEPSGAGPLVEGASYPSLEISVEANPLQVQRGRGMAERAAQIARFYHSVVGDSPYSSFTTALIESDRPGGHSPAHFAALNQPMKDAPIVWRNDPVDFPGFPDFFLAHELAHQWWGQGVGWQNYHEQWLSEGISQYFATLYAERHHGRPMLERMLRQMRTWALRHTDEGPVYLGYRLGHVKDDSRIFRALVYNKGAAVMHMLRRFVGDEAFFRGIRRFYAEGRYRKVGTEHLRQAMEAESGRSLARFFDGWIYGSTLPSLSLAHQVEAGPAGEEIVFRVTQTGEPFDVPVPVTLTYTDGRTAEVVVRASGPTTEMRVPLDGRLRSAAVNNDDGTLAEVRRTAF
jgi:hypothetical protein